MVCGKCGNTSGVLKCGRCRIMTYCNRDCQIAHWPEHKIRCQKFEMSPQKLHLHFTIGDEELAFLEDIPTLLCQRDAPRELTSQWASNLVDTYTGKLLAQYPNRCIYCPKQATALKTTLVMSLPCTPPTMRVLAHHLCVNNRNSPCAVKAEDTFQEVINAPDWPGADVYSRSSEKFSVIQQEATGFST
ncbi:Zinc finger MYND domain-containing protein 10 [Mycena sanguinolenta]|uniref:Zinc finger MYND domain-containing protein 10 n=1 Tax=Mycena sanguinolenta TaxID=230812 RepID=A0A8H6YGE2_9AGAR|nr:Zinc finger MYND domain-containing protein 10 [Mycena sanguinolenta]